MYFCVKVIELRYFLEFSYDGRPFSGMQVQPNAPTIQQEIEDAIYTLSKTKTPITAAGRTDAGVSAQKMFAHFDWKYPIENLQFRLNRLLPKEIAIVSITPVTSNAHARFDALYREYKYYIHFHKNPFLEAFSYRYPFSLNGKKMNEAAQMLLSIEDFSSFEKKHSDNKTSICELVSAEWEFAENQWVFTTKANRFLRNMVRAMVGTLWEVGRGRMSLEEFKQVIDKKERKFAGASAPAHALFLTDIEYPSEIFNV